MTEFTHENEPRSCSVGFNLDWEAQKKTKIQKIDILRREYITLYTQRDSMLSIERDDIYCRYVKLLGKEKYENFKLSVEVRMLKLKVELAQAALNRNQMPDINEIDRQARVQLEVYLKELETQSRSIKAAEQADGYSRLVVKELRELYHVLVRRLHPDLHPEFSDDMKDLFIKGQAAYRSYDIDTLREIIKRLDLDSTDTAIREESLDETIDRLSHDIAVLNEDITKLRASFPFDIEKDLLDPVWVNKQQNILKEERTQLENQKAMYADRLDLMTV